MPGHDPATLRRATRHVARADPAMAEIVRRVGPCRLPLRRDPGGTFGHLARAIVYQQISGFAAAAIFERLQRLAGGVRIDPASIDAASTRQLRAVGLSRQKIDYLRDLAHRVGDGLDLRRIVRLPDDDVIRELTVVKGIGRWTVEMLLLFHLGRLDVWPVGDYGVRKAVQRARRMRTLPAPSAMERVGAVYRPYRSVAAWYYWRSLELPAAGREA